MVELLAATAGAGSKFEFFGDTNHLFKVVKIKQSFVGTVLFI